MKGIRRNSFTILLAAGLMLVAGCGDAGTSDSGARMATVESGGSEREARPAPEFTRLTMDGDSLSIADLRGNVTLVNFWATWCGPCIVETPELVALYKDWEDRPFEIVGVSMDEQGFEAVKPFAESFGIQYAQVLDDGPLAEEYGVFGLPTTFILDHEGTIVHRFMGAFPAEDMRPELDKMVDRASQADSDT